MGVKNNFSQAVSELIGISKNVEPEPQKDEVHNEEVLEAEAATEGAEEEAALQDGTDEWLDSELAAEQKEEQPVPQNPKERIMAMLASQQAHQQTAQSQESDPQPQPQQFQEPQPEVGLTTIAKGTVIIGEINADGDVELLGSVKGKVASRGDIKANGKVIGDLIGRDIELISCAVQGNIIASGLVTVDGESVVIGDVKGENFCLDGKIKGNVTIEKEAKFQPKAILAGNVTTASIAMSQGAKIQGEVNIPLGDKETDMPFEIDMGI
ncbi:MAG TPA: polymer-forming cytoskeletal protein [Anaerovoracaceae bacterium]|nr:polymer-forming cytoskeletal protein [Anaerovoracaceae bacterium]